ncbi:GNAT family N-acetyltransferase [Bacteroides rodentium JCM 16496]
MEHLKSYILALKNMNTDFAIRIARQSDALELMSLFQETVLHINKRDYSEAEVADWASCGNDLSRIKEMIETHYFIVATNPQSQIVGFSSITQQGYLHSMFVHKDFQGKGIATILLNEIERYATATGIRRITSEVSLTARPFFEKRGYIVEVEQKRKANQLYLTNFWMAKGWLNEIP